MLSASSQPQPEDADRRAPAEDRFVGILVQLARPLLGQPQILVRHRAARLEQIGINAPAAHRRADEIEIEPVLRHARVRRAVRAPQSPGAVGLHRQVRPRRKEHRRPLEEPPLQSLVRVLPRPARRGRLERHNVRAQPVEHLRLDLRLDLHHVVDLRRRREAHPPFQPVVGRRVDPRSACPAQVNRHPVRLAEIHRRQNALARSHRIVPALDFQFADFHFAPITIGLRRLSPEQRRPDGRSCGALFFRGALS